MKEVNEAAMRGSAMERVHGQERMSRGRKRKKGDEKKKKKRGSEKDSMAHFFNLDKAVQERGECEGKRTKTNRESKRWR